MGQQYFPTPINHADSHWEKKEKPWKLTEEISFYHWLVPLVQQQQTHAAGAGSIAKWGAKAAASGAGSRQRSPGCQRPHAKNDSHPAKFSGSCVLTNWANLNQQNSVLAQGHATALNARACCPLTLCWQPGCSCVNTIVGELPLKRKDTRSGCLLPTAWNTHQN